MANGPIMTSQLLEQLAELNRLREQIRQVKTSNRKKDLARFKDRREPKTINTRRILH